MEGRIPHAVLLFIIARQPIKEFHFKAICGYQRQPGVRLHDTQLVQQAVQPIRVGKSFQRRIR